MERLGDTATPSPLAGAAHDDLECIVGEGRCSAFGGRLHAPLPSTDVADAAE
jgi:hypothetical protein